MLQPESGSPQTTTAINVLCSRPRVPQSLREKLAISILFALHDDAAKSEGRRHRFVGFIYSTVMCCGKCTRCLLVVRIILSTLQPCSSVAVMRCKRSPLTHVFRITRKRVRLHDCLRCWKDSRFGTLTGFHPHGVLAYSRFHFRKRPGPSHHAVSNISSMVIYLCCMLPQCMLVSSLLSRRLQDDSVS